MLRHLPNMLTLLHLFCGCIAVAAVFHGRYDHAAVLVIIAAILDFADGFVARLLKVTSPLGKELDSLADMVSFGVVPGVILFNLMLHSSYFAMFESRLLFKFLKYLMFIVPVFSALRLGKFNTDPRQTDYFIGLPTPANTLWIISLPFIVIKNPMGLAPYVNHPLVLTGLALLSAWMMVAELPLLSLKLKSIDLVKYKGQWLLLGGALVLLILFRYAAPPLIIGWYILLSLLFPPVKIISS